MQGLQEFLKHLPEAKGTIIEITSFICVGAICVRIVIIEVKGIFIKRSNRKEDKEDKE